MHDATEHRPPQGRNHLPGFPRRLRELRQGLKLTQLGLARLAGTSESAIAYLERGLRAPSLELACRLADALGVSVDEFRSHDERNPKNPTE